MIDIAKSNAVSVNEAVVDVPIMANIRNNHTPHCTFHAHNGHQIEKWLNSILDTNNPLNVYFDTRSWLNEVLVGKVWRMFMGGRIWMLTEPTGRVTWYRDRADLVAMLKRLVWNEFYIDRYIDSIAKTATKNQEELQR